ncbi:MAG: DNA polymerase/3'-5' exonuclease PolX [candidate division WS1 bacterium]|nr:DNA polymerase/3'-5' exonuclease PolX [candidate division WS1 bacterium]
MTNQDISRELEEIADLLEIAEANPFRIRSYRRASEAVADLAEEAATLVAEDRLTEVPGIGKGIAAVIEQLVTTGVSEDKEALLVDYPAGLLEMLRISGFGPRKAAVVYRELGISTVDDLEAAAESEKLQELPGMGAKTEEKLLSAIADYRRGQERALLGDMLPVAEMLVEKLRQHPDVIAAEYAGSTRRCRETVGDLDLLATSDDPAAVCQWFAGLDALEQVIMAGDTKVSGRLSGGRQVDLRVVEQQSFGAALQYFTGSMQHNVRVRERAQKMNLTVNEYGVFEFHDETKGDMVAGATEEEVYAALGLPWMAPELREDRGEIAAAEEGRLPDLIELSDICCDLQMHSHYSDGHTTIEQMARTCIALGYQYMGITDHSQALRVANGLDAERLNAQHEEVLELNEKLEAEGSDFVVLHGLEADILSDGAVDVPDGCFDLLDFVIGSLHQGFSTDADRITGRMVTAVESGMIDFVGHPTGRLLLARQPYGLHLDQLISACAEHDVALEINASPQRLDLDDVHSRRAVEQGCKLTINTDAHDPQMLHSMRYGVMQARRGWVEAPTVINTWPLADLKAWLAARRK